MNRVKLSLLLSTSFLWILSGDTFGQGSALNKGQYIKNIIPMRERVQIEQKFWEWKRENVLPTIMREQGVDLWIIRNDEEPLYRMTSYREHPVFTSLLPANHEGMVNPSEFEESIQGRSGTFDVFMIPATVSNTLNPVTMTWYPTSSRNSIPSR